MKLFSANKMRFLPVDSIPSKLTPKLFSGIGMFETMRVEDGVPIFLEEHIDRLKRHCKKVGWNTPKVPDMFSTTEGVKFGYAKLVFIPPESIFVLVGDFPYREDIENGVNISISDARRNDKGFSTGLKPISYFENVLLRETSGYDECVLLNLDGFVAEGTRSNIFWVRRESIFTPSLGCGILDGITRRHVIKIARETGINVVEGTFNLDKLLEADEIFLTSSLLCIAPALEVTAGGRKLQFEEGALTAALKQGLRNAIEHYKFEFLRGGHKAFFSQG